MIVNRSTEKKWSIPFISAFRSVFPAGGDDVISSDEEEAGSLSEPLPRGDVGS
jgi:hypothetical protein